MNLIRVCFFFIFSFSFLSRNSDEAATPNMFRLSQVFRAVLGLFVLNVSECFVLRSSTLLSPGLFASQGSYRSMGRSTKSLVTQQLGTLKLKGTKAYFGSRGSKPSNRVNVFSSLTSSVASTDKWAVLEQFQTTAEMEYFIVGDPLCGSFATQARFRAGAGGRGYLCRADESDLVHRFSKSALLPRLASSGAKPRTANPANQGSKSRGHLPRIIGG